MFHGNVVVVVVVVVVVIAAAFYCCLLLCLLRLVDVVLSDYRTLFVLLSFRRARDRERVGLF